MAAQLDECELQLSGARANAPGQQREGEVNPDLNRGGEGDPNTYPDPENPGRNP